jgi:hypothetical protein
MARPALDLVTRRRSEQDEDGRRPRAALGEETLGKPDVDVPAGRERPGLVRRVAGIHQDGEAPAEDGRFVDSPMLLLDRGHEPTLRPA